MQNADILSVVPGLVMMPAVGGKNPPLPVSVNLHSETLLRIGDLGDNWTVDDDRNRTCQLKLSPKWISQVLDQPIAE
jgi:hypothetical protein